MGFLAAGFSPRSAETTVSGWQLCVKWFQHGSATLVYMVTKRGDKPTRLIGETTVSGWRLCVKWFQHDSATLVFTWLPSAGINPRG